MYKLINLFFFLELIGIPDDGNNNPNKNYTDMEKLLHANIAIFICLLVIIGLLFFILIFQIIKTFKK